MVRLPCTGRPLVDLPKPKWITSIDGTHLRFEAALPLKVFPDDEPISKFNFGRNHNHSSGAHTVFADAGS